MKIFGCQSVFRLTLLFCFTMYFGQFTAQDINPQSVRVDSLVVNVLLPIQRDSVDVKLKHVPDQFYILNDKPVSREEYIEYLRLKAVQKKD